MCPKLRKCEKVWESIRKYEKVQKVEKMFQKLIKCAKSWESVRKFGNVWECAQFADESIFKILDPNLGGRGV